ncbi:lysM domain receptor-like kinase 3 [Prosopis cineraria]|uniref:lysM domain receptor-like kinase 3 n=1 Tax=Prosopis cineraria TaxID=364024 RepID=UPI00240EFAE4|nr:lysM domain receptor-like kinase 3 [Prosopis cineraria]
MEPRCGFVAFFFFFFFFIFFFASVFPSAESKCSKGCDLALASYYVWPGSNLSLIAQLMRSQLVTDENVIVSYNKDQTISRDYVQSTTRINIPFPCDCLDGEFLGHMFQYGINQGDNYTEVAETYYSNLTTVDMLRKFNGNTMPENGTLNVAVNCSCGNREVSTLYGLFITWPLRPEDTLESIANNEKLDAALLQSYNPGVNFSQGSGLVYIPGKDQNGIYVPMESSSGSGLSGGVIGGICIGVVAGLLLLAVSMYFVHFQKKKDDTEPLSQDFQEFSVQEGKGYGGPTGITVDKSVEFSYEELAAATDNFSMAKKIGQGGFGAVYYAELRGEKAAIKKMDMQATREFLAELKVLTNVHHLNLVRLIGYCTERSLFLVYEYIDNGNLSEHLRDSGRDPLPWSIRVQIALDSARGLEYIHEHTVPVYIHRDIKSANILIDNKFHGKVADFGLTKLTEVGNASLPTGHLVGTFGYMPPEYAQYGDVSPKVDVYAFGVVLFELISAKEAIVRTTQSDADSKALVTMFHEVLEQPDPTEDLCKLVDPRLGNDYPIDSVLKMAQLARACTLEYPQLRPTMRSIVVALMTLYSSTTNDWDVQAFYNNPNPMNLMSGR